MQRRVLGSTGEELSIIGMGGIVVMNEEQTAANRVVAEAVDQGVTYFDVAPGYGDAEEKLGPALEPYRSGSFLACKTGIRTRDGARQELERSLRRLRTDHLDLYQLHAMTSVEDFEAATGPGGAIDAFVEAREKGLVRYLGFSAHSVEVALKLLDAFAFDSVLLPVNWVNCLNGNFGPQVVAKATAMGVGVLALKAMALTEWGAGEDRRYSKPWYKPIDDPYLANLALRYTLSHGVTAAIPPGDIYLFQMALAMAEDLGPLSAEEMDVLNSRAQGLEPIFRYQG